MGLLSLTLPTIGQPNNTEDTKVRDALSAIQTEFNGNIEDTNLASTLTQQLVPVGTILPYGGSAAPSGYLMCDGTAVTRGSYAALFTVLGETYGAGDGSTTFNLPDLRGRVAVGAGTATGAAGATAHTRGESDGEETHALTQAEMPAHTHTCVQFDGSAGSVLVGTGGQAIKSGDPSGSTGGNAAHNNMQPYQVVNHIIKT